MGQKQSRPAPAPPPPVRTMPPQPTLPPPKLKDPWRPVKWSEKEVMLEDLRAFNPHLQPLKILLYGAVGAGKSCFVNSVQRALLGRNVIRAHESSAGTGASFTLSIKTHKMLKPGGGHYPFVLRDLMGLENANEGIQTEDLIKVLEGRILDDYSFNPRAPITPDHQKYKQRPKPCDRIHCLVGIVSADAISRMDQSVIDKMKAVRKRATELNIPQVIVLTKVDTACEVVNQDLNALYYSRKIKEKVEQSSNTLGVPVKNIYPVKNYHAEITEDTNIDVTILMALRDIIYFANDYVENLYESGNGLWNNRGFTKIFQNVCYLIFFFIIFSITYNHWYIK